MKRIGFTLVELLVVIAIIGLLMAVLVPVLQRAKRQTRAILCGSNIKQLLVGLFAYESENDSLPPAFDDSTMSPPPGGWPGFLNYDFMGWWWFNYISISGDSKKDKTRQRVVWCPSRRLKDPMFKDNVLCGNYGINRSVCKNPSDFQSYRQEFVGTPLRCTIDIPHPSRTLLIVDCGYSMITWWHAADIPPHALGPMMEDTAYIPGLKINGEKELWPGQKDDAINGRHLNKTVNVGFADGHVERKKADELLVENTGDDSYNNIKPLWRPR